VSVKEWETVKSEGRKGMSKGRRDEREGRGGGVVCKGAIQRMGERMFGVLWLGPELNAKKGEYQECEKISRMPGDVVHNCPSPTR